MLYLGQICSPHAKIQDTVSGCRPRVRTGRYGFSLSEIHALRERVGEEKEKSMKKQTAEEKEKSANQKCNCCGTQPAPGGLCDIHAWIYFGVVRERKEENMLRTNAKNLGGAR